MGLFSIGNMVLRSLFGKPATLMYPVVPRVPTPNTRGHISIDIESCIFCGICNKKCPTGAIDVSRADKKWEIERLRCIQCNCCVEVCPKKCLTMEGSYTSPSTGSVRDIFVQAPKPEAPKAEPAAAPATPAAPTEKTEA